jgi:putative transcriptional regulator
MNEETFQGIAAGLEDTIAFVQGDASQARVVIGINVKAVREATGMTQAKFAATYQIPVGTIRDWE